MIDIGELQFGPLAQMIVGFLENVEVDEPFRRRGVGTALLRAALDLAWECDAQNVRWTVDWSNGGHRFWEVDAAIFHDDVEPSSLLVEGVPPIRAFDSPA